MILESAITSFMAMYYVQYFALWVIDDHNQTWLGFLAGTVWYIWRIFGDVRKSLTGEIFGILRVYCAAYA